MADNSNSIRMSRCLTSPRHTMLKTRRYRSARKKTAAHGRRKDKPPPGQKTYRQGLLNENLGAADFVQLHLVGRSFSVLGSSVGCRSPPLLTF